MKKVLILVLSIMALLCLFSSVADAGGYTDIINHSEAIYSPCIYMVSLDDPTTIVYEKNPDEKVDTGSLAKLVMGMLAINECGDISQTVIVQQSSLDYVSGTGWGVMNLMDGEEVPIKDLLYCTMMANANDTCFVLADSLLGGVDACVGKMNAFVSELGCTNTHFVNINGLSSSEQYTTARDMVTIYSACYENATFREIMGTTAYYMAPTNLYNGKRLGTTDYSGLTSSAYGNSYTNTGRYASLENNCSNVVATSSYEGYNYILCCLNGPITEVNSTKYRASLRDADTLFTWAHTKLKLKTLVSPDRLCGEAKVKYSAKYDYLALYPEKEIKTLVPDTIEESSLLIEIVGGEAEVRKTVKKGDVICQAQICYAGNPIAQINLVAGYDVKLNPLKILTGLISDSFHSPVFQWSVYILIAGAALVFIGVNIKIKRSQKEQTKRNRSGKKNIVTKEGSEDGQKN